MPLAMVTPGTEVVIRACNSNNKTKKYLEGLGVMPGSVISVVNEMNGNLIIGVKGARLAISKGMAQQLMVEIFEGCQGCGHRRRVRKGGSCL